MNEQITATREQAEPKIGKSGRLKTLETYFLLFITGSVIGWFYELIFYFIMENRLANHGFFYGPYLPIYGFGTLFIILCTKRFKKYPWAVFLITIPVTGILEYITGYVMYELWATRWWDYRGLFMNIGGYVCLRSVVTFAIASIFLIYLVEPLVKRLTDKMNDRLRNAVCLIIVAGILVDIAFTVLFRMPAFA